MPYTSSLYVPKARFEAVQLVVKDGLKASRVAIMYGVNRSTIGKWVKRFAVNKLMNDYNNLFGGIKNEIGRIH